MVGEADERADVERRRRRAEHSGVVEHTQRPFQAPCSSPLVGEKSEERRDSAHAHRSASLDFPIEIDEWPADHQVLRQSDNLLERK